jgi:hypothetical protein
MFLAFLGVEITGEWIVDLIEIGILWLMIRDWMRWGRVWIVFFWLMEFF